MSLSVFAPDGEIVLHWSELGGLWSLDCRWLVNAVAGIAAWKIWDPL